MPCAPHSGDEERECAWIDAVVLLMELGRRRFLLGGGVDCARLDGNDGGRYCR